MNNTPNEIVENEWMHLFDVNALEDGPAKLSLSPSEEEKKRLAQRLGLVSIDSLTADIEISRTQGNVSIRVSGVMSAELIQNCVVTLEPVNSSLNESFEAWFADHDQAISFAKARKEQLSKGGHHEVQILGEEEDPEPIIDDKIDLGELVTQYLSLSINPYPHAEGVHFEVGDDTLSSPDKGDSANNPFAALKDWKMKLGEEEH